MLAIFKKTPIPIAGLALGLVACGVLLEPWWAPARNIGAVLATIALLPLVIRLFLYPADVRNDFRSSIFASVSTTFFMTFMQLAAFSVKWFPIPSYALWCAAVLGHLAVMVWFTARYIVHFDIEEVFPTYFICYVGIAVASLTGPAFGATRLGRALFYVAAACFAVLLIVVIFRYVRFPVPEPAKPLICIFAAPFSLLLAAYLTSVVPLTGGAVAVVVVVQILAQGFFIFTLFKLPGLLRLRFYPGYAAMTFPFVVTATALAKTVDFLQASGVAMSPALSAVLEGVVLAETAFATIMVLYVLVRYVMFYVDVVRCERTHDPFADIAKDRS